MSFSSKVKHEILQDFGEDRHCRIAFLSAIINGVCEIGASGGGVLINPRMDSAAVRGAIGRIIVQDFAGLSHEKILQATGFLDSGGNFERKINRLIVKKPCCKRAYLRAVFMVFGSVNGPQKEYHLEFVAQSKQFAAELTELLRAFGLTPKLMGRKNRFIVYFKESEQIAEVLNIIGAHKSFLEFENNRAGKELGNSINRAANCEAANADKSVLAAVKQIEHIRQISEHAGLDSLPPTLYECARLRLEYPELSLTEIGERMSPPISKSGVNHRFRKISEIAKNYLYDND